MVKYYVKLKDFYVTDFDDDGGSFTTNSRGYVGSLSYAKGIVESLDNNGFGLAQIFELIVTEKKVVVEFEHLKDNFKEDGNIFYILESDKSKWVYQKNDYGEITFSFQRRAEITQYYILERYLKSLEEYGMEGFKIKEVTRTETLKEVVI